MMRQPPHRKRSRQHEDYVSRAEWLRLREYCAKRFGKKTLANTGNVTESHRYE